jgi:hypothetical protein
MSDSAAALLGDNGAPAAPAAGVAPSAPPSPGSVWTAAFDEDTNAYVSNKGWKEPQDLLTSYRNLEKFAGGAKNLLELPPEGATPEQLDAFYSKLGRPGNPDEYGLDVPQGGDPELTNWFKGTAHKLGLTATQAKALYSEWNGMSGTMQEKLQTQRAQETEAELRSLKGEWGQAYDTHVAAGRRAVQALGLDAARLSAYEDKLGTGEMLKLFATLGSKMGEDSFEGGRGDAGFGTTPAQARQEIADLKMNKEFMGNYIAGNPDAVNKMRRLMEAAHAGT